MDGSGIVLTLIAWTIGLAISIACLAAICGMLFGVGYGIYCAYQRYKTGDWPESLKNL